MALRLRGFMATQDSSIRRGLHTIDQRLADLPCPMPLDLCEQLKEILAGSRPIVDVVYGGDGDGHLTPYARSAGYRILLYKRAFFSPPKRKDQGRLAAVLFHELIHISRGWELDAEAFENACFTFSEGARPPTKEDWSLFEGQRYRGWWVQLDPRTRRVADYADRTIVAFPPRPR